MIELADFFDALVEDEAVAIAYADFVRSQAHGKTLLDLACGTGTISQQLKQDFTITGLDQDPAMLKRFNARNPGVLTILGSMEDLSKLPQYDIIFLFGDSLNYVLSEEGVKKTLSEAIKHLNPQGVFLFDLHTEDRYEEFKTEYIEEGIVLGKPFQWTIQSLPEGILNHHFAFFDEEGHAETLSFDQRVYSLSVITDILEEMQADYTVYNDTDVMQSASHEKYLVAVRRT